MCDQHSAKLQQWLYDLFREVVEIHVAFPDPPMLANSGGSFPVDRPTLPGQASSPVVPGPHNLRAHPIGAL
jgi:hypothetical protein